MTSLERIRQRGHVRWGFVGCGDVTEVKSGPAFSRIPGSSVSVVMRRDAEKARDYAARHQVPRWTTDATEVIESDDVDAVYVATPPASHAAYALQAAAAGKPVYVEKPLALDRTEGEAMVRACEAAGVPLFVAYYRRALPASSSCGRACRTAASASRRWCSANSTSRRRAIRTRRDGAGGPTSGATGC